MCWSSHQKHMGGFYAKSKDFGMADYLSEHCWVNGQFVFVFVFVLVFVFVFVRIEKMHWWVNGQFGMKWRRMFCQNKFGRLSPADLDKSGFYLSWISIISTFKPLYFWLYLYLFFCLYSYLYLSPTDLDKSGFYLFWISISSTFKLEPLFLSSAVVLWHLFLDLELQEKVWSLF